MRFKLTVLLNIGGFFVCKQKDVMIFEIRIASLTVQQSLIVLIVYTVLRNLGPQKVEQTFHE